MVLQVSSVLRWGRCTALLFALTVANTGGVAHAGDSEDEYKRITAAAIRDYNAGQYPKARALFLQAHALAPSARTLRALGSAAFELHHYVQAIQELNASLTDERAALDDALRSSVRALIRRAESSVARLEIAVEPAAAVLLLDGRRVAAGRLDVDPGEHRLLAKSAGHHEQSIVLNVESGMRRSVSLKLDPRVVLDHKQPVVLDDASVVAPPPSAAIRETKRPAAPSRPVPPPAQPRLRSAPVAALTSTPDARPQRTSPVDSNASTSITSRWWFWTGVGVLAAGAVAAGSIVALHRSDSPISTYEGSIGSAQAP